MENTSNALLMAAGILISVLLISLGTYLFATFGNYSKNINEKLTKSQIDEYNAQFTKYETTLSDETTYTTVYDIVTIINLAKDTNTKYTYDEGTQLYVDVFIGSTSILTEDTNELIKKYVDSYGNTTKFTCEVSINNKSGLVNKIVFNEVKK